MKSDDKEFVSHLTVVAYHLLCEASERGELDCGFYFFVNDEGKVASEMDPLLLQGVTEEEIKAKIDSNVERLKDFTNWIKKRCRFVPEKIWRKTAVASLLLYLEKNANSDLHRFDKQQRCNLLVVNRVTEVLDDLDDLRDFPGIIFKFHMIEQNSKRIYSELCEFRTKMLSATHYQFIHAALSIFLRDDCDDKKRKLCSIFTVDRLKPVVANLLQR